MLACAAPRWFDRVRQLAPVLVWGALLASGEPDEGSCLADLRRDPLGCLQQHDWRGLRRLMIDSVASDPEGIPCGNFDSFLMNRLMGMRPGQFERPDLDFCINLIEGDRDGKGKCWYGMISRDACTLRQCNRVPLHMLSAKLSKACHEVRGLVSKFTTGYAHWLEYLPESGWPWSLSAIWLVLEESSGSRWKSDEVLRSIANLELRRQEERHFHLTLGHIAGSTLKPARLTRPVFKVFALGMHASLLRAPLDHMARLVLKEAGPGGTSGETSVPAGSRLQVRAPAGTSDVICAYEPGRGCDASEPAFEVWARRHISKWIPDPETQHWNRQALESLPLAREDFLKLYSSDMREANILVCTEPLAFCTFFEGLSLPVLMYIGNPPLIYLRPPDFRPAMESVARLAAEPQNVLLSISPTNAVWVEHLIFGSYRDAQDKVSGHVGQTHAVFDATSMSLAAVDPPLGLHVGQSLHNWRPATDEGALGTVLTSKRISGSFDYECMLRLLLDAEASKTTDYDLIGLRHLQFIRTGDKNVPAQKQTFKAWSQFRAALMMPMDQVQMIMFDLYAISIPIFVPHPTSRLPSFVYYYLRAFQISNPGPDALPPGSLPYAVPWTLREDSPNATGGDLRTGWDSLRIWSMLTPWAVLPHLRHFHSLAEVFSGLLDLEGLRETSRRMALEHSAMMARSAGLWAGILGPLWQIGSS